MKIAIIGMGAAGISVLRELVKQIDEIENHSIIIYAEEDLFGTGLPYQKDDRAIILNQYTETMSLNPEDEHDFVKWVKRSKKKKDVIGNYMPRTWYGEYLLELLDELLTKSKAVVKKEVVTSIRVREDKKYIISTEKEETTVDWIHLTTGHLAYQDPYKLKTLDNYVHHPYPVSEKISDLPFDTYVGILGTGLTAIDLMIYLRKTYPEMRLAMVSPDGKFSSVRGPTRNIELTYLTKERLQSEKEKTGGMIPFETIKNWFKEEVKDRGLDLDELWHNYGLGTVEGLRFDLKHLDTLGQFQSIITNMKSLYADIWASLTEAGREEFLTNYADRFLAFRSPIPASSASKIIESVEKGKVKIYQDIDDIQKKNNGFQIRFKSSGYDLVVDYLVNGTGQTSDLNKNWHVQHELIQQLLDERILTPYKYGGVQILYPEMSAVSQRHGVLASFKIYGQLVSGIDYFNNTVDLISKSAINGVESMVREIT